MDHGAKNCADYVQKTVQFTCKKLCRLREKSVWRQKTHKIRQNIEIQTVGFKCFGDDAGCLKLLTVLSQPRRCARAEQNALYFAPKQFSLD